MRKVKIHLSENVKYFGALGISWLLAWFLGYIYHPMMLRMLSLSDFSALQTLVSIFNILSVFTAGIALYITQIVAEDNHHVARSKRIFRWYTKDMILLGVCLFLIFLVCVPVLRSVFDIHNIPALLLTWSILIIWFSVVVANGILQWLKKFIIIAKINSYSAVAKFVIGWLWVFVGGGIIGAIGGYIWLMVVYLILYFFYTYKFLDASQDEHLIDSHLLRSKNIVSMTHYSILCILLTTLANVDILVARLLFPTDISWAYAAISTLSKWMIFVSWLLESVYFPQLVRIGKHSAKLLIQALAMYAGIFALAMLFIWSIGWPVLNIIKEWLDMYVQEFAWLTVWALLISLITFGSKILLWRRSYRTNILLFMLLVTILLVTQYMHFNTLQDYIYSLCVVSAIGVMIIASYVRYKLDRTTKQIL